MGLHQTFDRAVAELSGDGARGGVGDLVEAARVTRQDLGPQRRALAEAKGWMARRRRPAAQLDRVNGNCP